ncbi:MAG TPA: hypothetical protein VHX65_01770 [Pirellulales bacterium]|jgi:hypothetical protein|nr:hypothetical protein [Pirellulales bacterium]
MDPKARPNHREYIEVLRRMTPGERLKKACEMSDFGRRLFRAGLRQRFPNLSEDVFHRLYLDRLDKCHNTNY